jgi:UDP-N-acetylmuramoyl-L-alanyl-D-glutamate--2,6-diaminopimelate ligase
VRMSRTALTLRETEGVELGALVAAVARHTGAPALALTGDQSVEVTGAVHDSRHVEPGSLYCCVPGAAFDGHDFAADAVAAGATALLVERPLDLGVPELRTPSVRVAMGPVAAALAGEPSRHMTVVGFTGTNGKTTASHLLSSILEADGRTTGVIGTLTSARTTPEAPELQQTLADLVAAGTDAVAMEVSSHALDLHRVDGTWFEVAVFTNLSQDHLDYHGDMSSYFQAKARLFDPSFCGRAVLNLDDPHGRLLYDAATVPSVGYSLDDAGELEVGVAGSRFTWRGAPVELGLAGRFNVSNAIAAATVAELLGVAPEAVAAGLSHTPQVAGRFERIDAGQPFLVAVDYAHTPDGLVQLLGAGRELAGDHRVVVVFGAGGDRDRAKRPLMGEAADRLADVVVLTDDNPRSEDPDAIITEVQQGMEDRSELHVERDRRAAISLAVGIAEPGDVVLIAGKGHETTQTVGADVVAFDDREVTRSVLVGHAEQTR